jgi:hypothetical protein
VKLAADTVALGEDVTQAEALQVEECGKVYKSIAGAPKWSTPAIQLASIRQWLREEAAVAARSWVLERPPEQGRSRCQVVDLAAQGVHHAGAWTFQVSEDRKWRRTRRD